MYFQGSKHMDIGHAVMFHTVTKLVVNIATTENIAIPNYALIVILLGSL